MQFGNAGLNHRYKSIIMHFGGRRLEVFLAMVLCSTAVTKPLRGEKRQAAGVDDTMVIQNNDDLLYYSEYDYDYKYEDDYSSSPMFTCFEGGEDVTLSVMCDGYNDCSDGSDEIPANCKEHITSYIYTLVPPASLSEVASTVAPLPPYVPDIEDVEVAYSDYDTACDDGEFQCLSDEPICVPHAQICDGIHDCPDMDDEENCTDEQYALGPRALAKEENINIVFEFPDLNGTVEPVSSVNLNIDTLAPNNSLSEFEQKSDGTPELLIGSSVAQSHPIQFRPPYPIFAPPPVFLSEREDENENLNLESNYDYYDYLILDRDGYVKNEGPGQKLEESEAALSVPAQNDITLTPRAFADEGMDHESHTTSHLIHGQNEREFDLKPSLLDVLIIKKQVAKQKKKVRGMVGQLLQELGKLLEEEEKLTSEGVNTPLTNIGLIIDTELGQEINGLYSRIICSSKSPTRLNFSVDL